MWTVRGHVVCLPLGGQVTGSKKCRHRHRQRTVGHDVPNSDSSGPTIHPDTSYRWDAPSQMQKHEPKQDSKERSLCDLRLSQARSKERRNDSADTPPENPPQSHTSSPTASSNCPGTGPGQGKPTFVHTRAVQGLCVNLSPHWHDFAVVQAPVRGFLPPAWQAGLSSHVRPSHSCCRTLGEQLMLFFP